MQIMEVNVVTPEQCLEKFGKPELYSYMIVWDVPEILEIGFIPKKIYCNKLMVNPLTRAFGNLIESGCVDELKTWDGCFNIRASKGSKKQLSLHAWGIAIDMNASWNAYGVQPTLSKAFVKCFADAGFDWGGRWSRPDGMHFQLSKI